MSSKYPTIDSRPIEQWKVTELKEELKRRKLTTKGLKDDLIKRLGEALLIERENDAKDVDADIDLDKQPVDGTKFSEAVPVVSDAAKVDMNVVAEKTENVGDIKVQVDINDSAEATGQEPSEGIIIGGVDSSMVDGEHTVPAATLEISTTVSESVASEETLGGQDAQNSETQELNGDSKLVLDNEDTKPQLDLQDSKSQLDYDESKPQLEDEGLRAPHEVATLDSSAPNNQVSEVSPNLGFQVKSDSISTDSVSINEKIELKDNINADNVKLELDVVKPEMVEPSSNNVIPVGGESYPMDVEEPQEKKASVEEKDDSNSTNPDMSKKNDIIDVGYSEKLNLDRSSGDDSMEEDVVESKQIDSNYNSDDVGDKSEKSGMHVVNEENTVDVVGSNLSLDQKEMNVENKTLPAVPAEKRKLNDQDAVESAEPLKRQRRWKSEGLKVPEHQSSNVAPATTPKDASQPTLSRRNFSRSDSSVSVEDAPRKLVVPPSQKPQTNSLRIDNFVRPFTLKAVQELLGKTGKVTSFWMDQIKTHCYVSYSSVEEAIETRNAVYNLQWPSNGGRLLAAEFVDPKEVKIKVEAPPATPVTPGATAAPSLLEASPRQQVSRQQLPPPPPLPSPPPLSNPSLAKERLAHPQPPPLPEKHDPPIVTLDDLFRKTRATPRIYYLPMSEKQVAAKLAERGKNAK
ncbi:hypothetical protein GH714_018905 [Hevea brasiliensis]|uniref:SAP domain-containing protein n=1 Tax=Hevea brasiliensis TaxID=3981 RepID=A0A6A6K7C0_HEVBR|nr:hypothetical protein GH714_018905 [Hevea brasiliensis]